MELRKFIATTIREYLNDVDVGEDIYQAKIIDVIMSVTGVENCALVYLYKSTSAPGLSDVTILSSEITKSGTITVNTW